MATAEKFDPYQAVTDQIITLLEAGTAPWRKPWNADGGLPKSLTTGKAYRGINPFLLQMAAMEHGFTSPYWATYKAIADKGGQVRKGEKSTLIVFWKQFQTKEVTAAGKPKMAMVLRSYRVFNVEQADAVEGKTFRVPATPAAPVDHDPIAEIETTIAPYVSSLASLRFGGDLACYSPATDDLYMPPRNTFATVEGYYSTLFHELTHSTGHADRLNRPDLASFSHFGDKAYSKEELVAEMGAAMLSGITGIAPATLDNSAAYLASWIKVLRGDSKLIISAAAQAQKAADKVLGVSFASQAEEVPAA